MNWSFIFIHCVIFMPTIYRGIQEKYPESTHTFLIICTYIVLKYGLYSELGYHSGAFKRYEQPVVNLSYSFHWGCLELSHYVVGGHFGETEREKKTCCCNASMYEVETTFATGQAQRHSENTVPMFRRTHKKTTQHWYNVLLTSSIAPIDSLMWKSNIYRHI